MRSQPAVRSVAEITHRSTQSTTILSQDEVTTSANAQLLHEGRVDTLLYSASWQGVIRVQLDTRCYSDTVASEWQHH